MARFLFGGIATLALMFASYSAGAADVPLKAPPPAASPPAWTFELGARWFFSGQRYQKDLYDPFVTSALNSRLTYDQTFGNSAEIFGRVDFLKGLFLKGNAGIGWMSGGNLQDEDFPPAIIPYSSTNSNMRDGKLGYATVDLGYNFFGGPTYRVGGFDRRPTYRVGGFVGYFHQYEKFNGYGCTQTATNPFVCFSAIPDSVRVLTETARWNALRLGLVGDIMLWYPIKLTGEVAWLPYVEFDAYDNHWLRPDINPLSETGHGMGVQAEAIVSYAITPAWSAGIGGRYWHLETTSANTQFPGFPSSPMKFTSDRWGAFIQTSYMFH